MAFHRISTLALAPWLPAAEPIEERAHRRRVVVVPTGH
jgi:hypothetical protein